MCKITQEYFKYASQKFCKDKSIVNSQKLNLYAKKLGYKNYNAILPILKKNKSMLDKKLFEPEEAFSGDLEDIIETMLYPNRAFKVKTGTDADTAEFYVAEYDGYLFDEELRQTEAVSTAKSIGFFMPKNTFAIFSSFQITQYADRENEDEIESAKECIKDSMIEMLVDADEKFYFGATASVADVTYDQYMDNISRWKNIFDAENAFFFHLHYVYFPEEISEELVKKNLKDIFHTFIHKYMLYDYYTITSFVMELPFNKEKMNSAQFDFVQIIIDILKSSYTHWNKIFTNPIHKNYFNEGEDGYSYIYFARKDIEGLEASKCRKRIPFKKIRKKDIRWKIKQIQL